MTKNLVRIAIIVALGLIIIWAMSCHPPQEKLYEFSQGASMANAVVINETTEIKAIPEEYAWIQSHYKKYRLVSQRLMVAPHGRKRYEVITIVYPDGNKQDIYFDISKL